MPIFWGTKNELDFINKLGTYSNTEAKRPELLKGYLEGAMLRDDWGHVKKEVVIKRVQTELGVKCPTCGHHN